MSDKILETKLAVGSWVFRLVSAGGFMLLLYICDSALSEIKATSSAVTSVAGQVATLGSRIEVMDKVWQLQNDSTKAQISEIKADIKTLDSRLNKLEKRVKD